MRLQLSDARFDNPFSYSSIVRASMPKLIEPSRSRVGCPNTTTSATICLGMANSASASSPVTRL